MGIWFPLSSLAWPGVACCHFVERQLKQGVATQAELDAIKGSVLESYEKDFEVTCRVPFVVCRLSRFGPERIPFVSKLVKC